MLSTKGALDTVKRENTTRFNLWQFFNHYSLCKAEKGPEKGVQILRLSETLYTVFENLLVYRVTYQVSNYILLTWIWEYSYNSRGKDEMRDTERIG